MISTTNIHGVTDVYIARYNHEIDAITFLFECGDGQSHTTAFGINPRAALKIMSVLGNEHTRIYINDRLMKIDDYVEELKVVEVLDKLKGDTNAT
tara:strand:+ start:2509 stop:2793 length:285 start_codon:yes stop_codon:yes gene_type:complete